MTWTTFLLITGSVYGLYYGLNLLFDGLRGGKAASTPHDADELVFSEDTDPEPVDIGEVTFDGPPPDFPGFPAPSGAAVPRAQAPMPADAIPPGFDAAPTTAALPLSAPVLQSTGAVSIRELFELARQDLIEFTKGAADA